MNRIANKKIQVRTESLAALLLLIVMAGFTALIIAETGGSYRRLTDTSEVSQELRTSLCFVATSARVSGGRAAVRSLGGGNAVVISQPVGQKQYEDWIFYYKNTLREVLVPKGGKIVPQACQVIAHINRFDAQLSGGLLRVTAGAQSGSETDVRSLTLAVKP